MPAVPAIQPVAGTESAARAAEAALRATKQAAGSRPHIVLDPDLAGRPKAARQRGVPAGMTPVEAADRIVASILQGSGPILLIVPGTLAGAYDNSMLATARAFATRIDGPSSIASIPYPNGVFDVVTRALEIGIGPDQNVLAQVIRKLRAAAPHRPILLAGESQGAWLIADTLRQDPSLAAAVTRVVMMAKPGFVRMPESIGTARLGAALLPGTASGVRGILEFRHTDDIVPSLFGRLGPHVFAGYVKSLTSGKGFAYEPHHYDWHDQEAARWLLEGTPPVSSEVHASGTHPVHRAGSGFG